MSYGKKIFPLRIYRSESLYSPPNNVLEISEQKIDISSASFLANQKNYVETKFLSNKTSTTVRMFRIIVTRNLHRPIYSRPVCSKFLISKPPGELRNTSSIGTTTGPSNKSPSDKLEDTSSIGTTTDPSNKSPSGESRRYISSGSSLIDERYIENMFTKFQNKILFAFIGATMSIIFTVIGSSKWYVDRASEKIDDVKSILNLNETGKEIIDDIRILLDKNENKTDKNENETDKKKKK
ncbi:hypothetical protein GLOIN_2v1560478 [Rhizophagus irregularis DAOM 181602=DAOM 197198]|nr:hypothetical protein GLOIN_2v1560478 [Rhizophagus irregularis DAOM 181602=DAOM 197198]